jgi:hypothetical protein
VNTGNQSQHIVPDVSLDQPFSIFLPWRNPWNNFQVSGNPCIKIIISTAHGTLAWSVSCKYNNPTIIVNALLSREWYFSVDLFILANKFKIQYIFFSITVSRGTPSDISRNHRVPWNPGWETLVEIKHEATWNCWENCSNSEWEAFPPSFYLIQTYLLSYR